jgi:hypothetical protein
LFCISPLLSLRPGIDIGGEKVCILLYAYDIVLLADTESDLQNLLDRLCTWCNNNNMTINACTSNVVHWVKGDIFVLDYKSQRSNQY